MENVEPNKQVLIDIVKTRMPYGKYKGTLIADLPPYYLEWMASKGFSKDKLGMLLSTTFEIKTNGVGAILEQIKQHVAHMERGQGAK
ncbi:hypothetical protein C8P68_105184 [Mucilaginibacter yixingensis]|uniref:DUF3820 family protein n=1 Tax=Mucilaginibacter yixingensis TaxID=1295612 RepID=A0A2T5J889_9SPHI|nr:DUF3820 family protein [Mucilaginibacter yixingensis]PTQ95678.1 hypothetical protein C8P68_105184 [Mucilaginibacter yixingensis]